MSPFSRPRLRMLSVKGPSNIPGKIVKTSNRIEFQQPFRRHNLDDAFVRVNPLANGAGERNQPLPPPLALHAKQVGPSGRDYFLDPPEENFPWPDHGQTHEAENII